MDGTTIALVVGLAEVVVLVVLWMRVRAAESFVAEEMTVRVDAARQAIDTLQERLSPLNRAVSTDELPESRRQRRGRRKRS